MAQMTVKEWAAEYRRINEAEQQERIARLPQESIEDSVRAYFALCTFLLKLSNEAEKSAALWEQRMNDYRALIERWERLASRAQHASQS
jgi:hypothetical protein